MRAMETCSTLFIFTNYISRLVPDFTKSKIPETDPIGNKTLV